jgi:hypothetical protein
MADSRTRRRLLAALAGSGALAVSGALAGCLTPSGGDGSTARTDRTARTGTTAGATTTPADGVGDETTTAVGETETSPTGTTVSLDLREANVVGVGVSETDSGIRFDVTLIHDDDGEDGYANWWIVETLDGEELGRRDLAHAHGTREFTRSETVSIPGNVECVVVRGHDQTHGYGGKAALVSVSSGSTRFLLQGSEPTSFANADCP